MPPEFPPSTSSLQSLKFHREGRKGREDLWQSLRAFCSEIMEPLWTLKGSGVLLLRNATSTLALIHYETSPVGPYDELAIAKLSIHGPTVVKMPVTSPASCEAGRALWGFPKTVRNLSWKRKGRHIEFYAERESFRFRTFGFSFPLRAKAWTVQTLRGKSVRVPCEIAGRAKLAFRSKQLALCLEEFELRVFPANTEI